MGVYFWVLKGKYKSLTPNLLPITNYLVTIVKAVYLKTCLFLGVKFLVNYYKYHDNSSLTTNGEYSYEYNNNDNFSSDVYLWREYIPFFIKPVLKITVIESHENTDKRWDKNDEGNYPIRKFINIKVENKGKIPARQCQVKLGLSNIWLIVEHYLIMILSFYYGTLMI